MKLLIEILLAIFLHPLVVVLVWIHLAGRSDMGLVRKLIWALVSMVWGIGPILYVVVGNGTFW